MGQEARRARAQVARLTLLVALLAPAIAGAGEPRASSEELWGCAGDGAPARSIFPSGYVAGAGVVYAGRQLDLRYGGVFDDAGFTARAVRLGLCGRVRSKIGIISYDIIYEPYDNLERAHRDAYSWGRFRAAEVGLQPWRWLGFFVGIRRPWVTFGHDEPDQAVAIPVRPRLDRVLGPDSRLGATIDLPAGALRLVVGGYESARQLGDLGDAGVLVTARALIEPIGPVGRALSTLDDDGWWRKRARFGLNLSVVYEWTPQAQGYVLGADVPFKWGPIGFVVEYLYASNWRAEDPVPLKRLLAPASPRETRQGLWAEAAVMLWRPFVELAARYEWDDSKRERFHGPTVALNVYAIRSWARISMVYEHRFYLSAPRDDDELSFVLSLSR